MQKITQGCLCLCLFLYGPTLYADPRQVKNPSAPTWLNAVGKLNIPSQSVTNGNTEHYIEHCSATLIADNPKLGANTILTAWHCLEGYSDLSREISFTLFHGESSATNRIARQLSSGGDLDRDWAILRLNKPIPSSLVKPIIINSSKRDSSGHSTMTMAGYSRDPGLGQKGEALTYHAGCQSGEEIGQQLSSNCLVYSGASGGPVVISSYQNNSFQHRLAGVISQGNGVDITTYVPDTAFIATALRLIRSNKR